MISAYDTAAEEAAQAEAAVEEEEEGGEEAEEEEVKEEEVAVAVAGGNSGAEGWIGNEWTLSPPSESTSEGSDGGMLTTSFFISPAAVEDAEPPLLTLL